MEPQPVTLSSTQLQLGQDHILFDPTLIAEPQAKHFSPEYWNQQGQLSKANSGRGSAFFIRSETNSWVLRRYLRGGMVRHLLSDQYLNTGEQNSRSFKEFTLLQTLYKKGLPVPRPVAAIVSTRGVYYRAALLIETIAGAQDLYARLQQQAISAERWRNIGACIRRFHDAGLYHHDLNIRNVLLDQQDKVWLIDFDRCGLKSGKSWKPQNIDRLKRSFDKERKNTPELKAQLADWQYLLDGYNIDPKD